MILRASFVFLVSMAYFINVINSSTNSTIILKYEVFNSTKLTFSSQNGSILYSYLGCYGDRGVPYRAMSVRIGAVVDSVNDCYNLASFNRYLYFSLQNGVECWVSNNYNQATEYNQCGPGCIGSTESCACNIPCTTQSPNSLYCGGGWANQLYVIGAPPTSSPASVPTVNPSLIPTEIPTISLKPTIAPTLPYNYLGCYADKGVPFRTMDITIATGVESIYQCYTLATNKKYTLFSMQNGNECWGSNNRTQATRYQECPPLNKFCRCNNPCAVGEDTCGGSWTNQLYMVRAKDTPAPSSKPTTITPMSKPSRMPSIIPSKQPIYLPSSKPSHSPSTSPSITPTLVPSFTPSVEPTFEPSIEPTIEPSNLPTICPTIKPSKTPTRIPTTTPSRKPSASPSSPPTFSPSEIPTSDPTSEPSIEPTVAPSSRPSKRPSTKPTRTPISNPTYRPSMQPVTHKPTVPGETDSPTTEPTFEPTCDPTSLPTFEPSVEPSCMPTKYPTVRPTRKPSRRPSKRPTRRPTFNPTILPSFSPSDEPTCEPSFEPSTEPTVEPSIEPSYKPSKAPTPKPSRNPSCVPTRRTSLMPIEPTMKPTTEPSRLKLSSTQPQHKPTPTPGIAPIAASTMTPSVILTLTPTINDNTKSSYSHFSTVQTISFVSSFTLSSTNGKKAFLDAATKSMKNQIPSRNIVILNIADDSVQRPVVYYDVGFTYFTTENPLDVALGLAASLQTSILSGEFTSYLVSYGVLYGVSGLLVAQANTEATFTFPAVPSASPTVKIYNKPPSLATSKAPVVVVSSNLSSNSNSNTTSTVIAATAVSLILLIACLATAFWYREKKTKEEKKLKFDKHIDVDDYVYPAIKKKPTDISNKNKKKVINKESIKLQTWSDNPIAIGITSKDLDEADHTRDDCDNEQESQSTQVTSTLSTPSNIWMTPSQLLSEPFTTDEEQL